MYHFFIIHSPSLNQYKIGHAGASIDLQVKRLHSDIHQGLKQEDNWKVVHKERFSSKIEMMTRYREVRRWNQIKVKRLANA